jgi:hypothetical protein
MYYSYVEIEYVATSFSPARADLALKLLNFLLRLSTDRFRSGYRIKWTSATLSHAVEKIGRYSSRRSRKLSTSSVEYEKPFGVTTVE